MSQRRSHSRYRPNLLCVTPPPVSPTAPPAGAAYLLGYLKSAGCHDFDFLDLRLWAPDAYAPTWSYTGIFAESFVLDIPDLPLVLQLLAAFEDGAPLGFERTPLFERYCLERGIPPRYLHAYLSTLNRFFDAVFAQIPRIDFIGFTVWTSNYLATLLAAAHLKRRRTPPVIVAGGPQVTASRASGELALRSGLVDVVALGEGEETLLAIYRHYRTRGRVPADIPGTLAMDANGNFHRSRRPLLSIGTLPAPSFEEMHVEAYQQEQGRRILPMQFSRGCTDKCSFCSEWAFWERFRPDTVEHTVEHVEHLTERYGANFILFMDSLLNGVPKRLVAFAEALIRESVHVEWASFMRAQMDRETAELLARAGCHDVFVGIESFSDETLELMRKRRTKADNLHALEAFLDAGIAVTAGFVPGFPGDSRAGFIESAKILRELHERYPGLFAVQEEPFIVQPNSPIYDDLEAMGLSPTTWAAEYLDIAPRYRDITENVYCTVEGDNQGLERSARVSIVRTIASDPLEETGFSFERSDEENLVRSGFAFGHLFGGFCVARWKSAFGHVYGLLVNEPEREELEALESEYLLEDPSSRRVASVLARLERAHLVAPSRRGPRIARGVYAVNGNDGSWFVVSPFIVARQLGGARGHQILVASVSSERWWRRPARDAPILALIAKRPASKVRLLELGSTSDRRHVQRSLRELEEAGIVSRCDVGRAGDSGVHRSRRPAEAV